MGGVRIVFAGTPHVAVPTLHALACAHAVVAVLTRPDAPVGRKRVLTPSPVKVAATELGIDVIEATRVDAPTRDIIASYGPEAGAVVAYGALLREEALAIPEHGWFNLHFSLLPAYRGAAPVQWALINGEQTTGLTIFQLDTGMDTGPVAHQRDYPMPDGSAAHALEFLARVGAEEFVSVMDDVEAGTVTLTPQDGEPSYAPKLTSEDAYLDFSKPAAELVQISRGVTPNPGAWATIEGKRTKLFGLVETERVAAAGSITQTESGVEIGTGTYALRVDQIQPFGKPKMSASDFVRGNAHAHFDVDGLG